jgi:hypothetical protein
MKLATVGPIDGLPQFLAAAGETLRSIREPVRLVVLYLPIAADHAAYLAGLGSLTKALIVGATTGGAAFTQRGFSESGAVAGFLHGEEPILADVALGLRVDVKGHVAKTLNDLKTRWKRESSLGYSVMVLSDPYACDGEALAAAVRDATPTHVKQFGGTAGDGFTFGGTKVFFRNRAYSDAAALVLLPATPGFAVGALHGFSPVPGSREMMITDIEGNVLKTLDGQPARTVYQQELKRLGLLKPADDLLTAMGIYELGARSVFDDQSLRVRTALQLEGTDVVLASSLPKDSVVRIVAAEPDRLIEAARRLSKNVTEGASNGALVFDCACRRKLLGDRYGEQVAAFAHGKGMPYVGFASYGELAKSSGSLQGFHNTTAVMAAF